MTAWKDLERSVMAALGTRRRGQITQGGWAKGCGRRRHRPLLSRSQEDQRYQLRRAWVDQARRQSKDDGRPWLLVIAEHGERNPSPSSTSPTSACSPAPPADPQGATLTL